MGTGLTCDDSESRSMVCQLASARTRPNASTLAGAKLCARATAARITSCTVPFLELVGELSLPVAGRFPGRTSWMSSCRPTRMRSVVTGGGGPAGAMGCECARHHRSESTFGMHRHPSSLAGVGAGRGGRAVSPEKCEA